MKDIILKNGGKVVIRTAKKEDAQSMIEYLNKIGGESDFLIFGENQFKMSVESEEEFIESTNSMDNSIMIVATINEEIISIGSINSANKERIKHNGVLGISISKKYWSIGLGSEVMKALIDWAKSNGITKRIELLVREDNYRAISLYEKCGFEREGLLKGEIYINGMYYNTIMMGLYI